MTKTPHEPGDEGDRHPGHDRPVQLLHRRRDQDVSRQRDPPRRRLGLGDAARDHVRRGRRPAGSAAAAGGAARESPSPSPLAPAPSISGPRAGGEPEGGRGRQRGRSPTAAATSIQSPLGDPCPLPAAINRLAASRVGVQLEQAVRGHLRPREDVDSEDEDDEQRAVRADRRRPRRPARRCRCR